MNAECKEIQMLSAKEVVKFDAEAAMKSVLINGPITRDGGNFTQVKWQIAECLRGIINAEMKKTQSASRKRDLREFGEQRGTHKTKTPKAKHFLPKTAMTNPFGIKSRKLGRVLANWSKKEQDSLAVAMTK